MGFSLAFPQTHDGWCHEFVSEVVGTHLLLNTRIQNTDSKHGFSLDWGFNSGMIELL